MDGSDSVKLLQDVIDLVSMPFWHRLDFYISTAVGLVSLVLSWFAYSEAKKARVAAIEAGKSVKIQTITVELSEIAQRLDKLDMAIGFSSARDLLNEVSRKIRRLVSPFENDDYPEMKGVIGELKGVLSMAKQALNGVKPGSVDDIEEVPNNAVYYAVESYFSEINGMTSDLIGLFEKTNLDRGE